MEEQQSSGSENLPHLLLVEDDSSFANLLKWVLEEVAEVEIRENADDVFELVDASWPDFIISDLHMPRVTGIELYELLKTKPKGRSIPFALLTGAYEEDRLKAPLPEARAVGIDTILSKDLGLDGLRDRISELLQGNS